MDDHRQHGVIGGRVLTAQHSVSPFELSSSSDVLVEGLNINSVYPNPFNPVTNVEYTLSESGSVEIIVLAVAILPMLGVGGMQLYQAEMPGPMKDHKLTPRIAETAKALWVIYVGLTLVCALAYGVAGMPWFNALGEAFSTVATGGFSMHDASFAYYHSMVIDSIAIIFMVLSSFNYGLHYMALRRGQISSYGADLECRRYVR